MSDPVLSQRALNRALLARQLLLERAPRSVPQALEDLVGLQSQAPYAAYVGLWSRLAGFTTDALAAELVARRAVRIVLMRSTIHLVTATDALWLRPLVQVVTERGLQSSRGKRLAGLDPAELRAAGLDAVAAEPLTFVEIGAALRERWPDRDPEALGQAVRAYVALVQPPPRGLLGQGGAPRHTSVERWLGRPVDTDASPDRLVLRYLAAFGPASVPDAQAWSGLTRLREVVERNRHRLRVFRDGGGTELFDLADAPRPDPDVEAPVRFVPEYDNLLLSHADRTRVIAPEHRQRIFTRGAVLVDGVATGAWRVDRARGRTVVEIEAFRRLSGTERAELEAEAGLLGSFVAPPDEQPQLRLRTSG